MSTAIARNLMAEMKLLGMRGAVDKALHDATREKTSYSELLDTLLQAEADYRQERKTGYRIKAAKFTLRPAFEDIDFTASRSISKAQIKELYGLQWLHDARPVLLIGPTGVGKSYIACAMGHAACRADYSVRFFRIPRLIDELARYAALQNKSTLLRQIAKADLLIIDLCAADGYVKFDADSAGSFAS